MDFTLSTEQTLLRDAVRSYCQRSYKFTDRLAILRSAEGFSRDHWRAFADLGWLGVEMPEEVGGSGASAIEMTIIVEGFGRCLVLEPVVACAVLAAHVLNGAADAEQRRRELPALIRGERLFALAHEEADARGSLPFVETRAVRQAGGGYVVSGRKSLVLGGSSADVLIVSARTAGVATDPDGISLFLIPPDAPGLLRRNFRTIDGGRAAEIDLHDVRVGAVARLGAEGDALAAIERAVERAIVAVCAEAVGAMDHVVTLTRDYLKTRRAYGTTLSTFQALQHRLADMLVETELSRSMVYRALAALQSADGAARRRAVSAAKALVGRSGRFVGANGIQLHGGLGMADDYVVGHLFKRLTVIETQFGSSDFHLTRVLAEPLALVAERVSRAPDVALVTAEERPSVSV